MQARACCTEACCARPAPLPACAWTPPGWAPWLGALPDIPTDGPVQPCYELFADLQQALRLVVGTSGLAPEALSAPATGFVLDCCDSPDVTDLRTRITAHRAHTESLFDRLVPAPSP